MTNACNVSILVVRKMCAFPKAVSVPSLKFSTSSCWDNSNSLSTVCCGKLTTAVKRAANTTAWMDGFGSIPWVTSSQNCSYRFSKLGRWTIRATGWTASQ